MKRIQHDQGLTNLARSVVVHHMLQGRRRRRGADAITSRADTERGGASKSEKRKARLFLPCTSISGLLYGCTRADSYSMFPCASSE